MVPLSRRIPQLLALALDHPVETFHDVVDDVPTGQRVGVVLLQPRQERIARAEAKSPLFRRAKRSRQIVKGGSHFRVARGLAGISGWCAEFTGTSRTVAFDLTRTAEVAKVTVGLVSVATFRMVGEALPARSTVTTLGAGRSLY
jgi:hypothetical protein